MCLRNLAPFNLPARKCAHNLDSAGVGALRSMRACVYPLGVVLLAGIRRFYPTPSLSKYDMKTIHAHD